MNRTVSQHLELIRRARQGDEKALGQLLDGHRAYLRLGGRRKSGGGSGSPKSGGAGGSLDGGTGGGSGGKK